MKVAKKLSLFAASGVALTAPIVGIVSCSWNPFKTSASFYNYVDYMSDDCKDAVSSSYTYSQFGDLPEFEQAILAKKAAGGVSSDYYIARMALEGEVQKLNFNSLLDGITVDSKTFSKDKPLSDAEIETALSKLYTPEVWDQMKNFDHYFVGDFSGNHLWQYMVPYFFQRKVVTINPFKVTAKAGHEDELNKLKSFDESVFSQVFADKTLTYDQIFDKLREIGFSKLTVNNYLRDNLMIGSENKGFTNELTEENYQSQIDGFSNLISKFGGVGLNKQVAFVDSGIESLKSVWSKNKDNWSADTALLYNGDALDAFLGDGQMSDGDQTSNGEIRVIVPKNTTYLLDGLVIPTYMGGADLEKIERVMHDALLKNANVVSKDIYDDAGTPNDDSDDTINMYNAAYNNFDFVNYTTPIKAIYDDVKANYFGELDYVTNGHGNKLNDADKTSISADKSGDYASHIFEIFPSGDTSHVTSIPYADDTVKSKNFQETVQQAYNKRFINN